MILTPTSKIKFPATSLVTGTWSDERGVTFATARADGPHRWIDWPGVGVFAFSVGSTTVHVAPARALEEVRDLFARVLEPVVLQALGRQALHASAVSAAGGALAFCGRGRSGKSTLAFALARRGFQQIADDALLIDAIHDDVVVRALPFVPQLREPSRRHFGDGLSRSVRSGLPDDVGPNLVPLRAVFLLTQDMAAPPMPVAVREPPVSGFASLLQHAHCFDQRPSFQAEALVDDYLRIIERVPVFGLRYAPSFGTLDALVQSVLSAAETLGVHPVRDPVEVARE